MAALTALLLGGCGEPDTAYQGYVEADYLLVAATSGGRIAALSVAPGATVAAGQPLFALDAEAETMAVAEAEARLAQALAQLQDLRSGQRPEEIAVLAAQLAEAEASLANAEAELGRQRRLVAAAVSAQRGLDDAATDVSMLQARVAALQAQIAVARLPARDQALAAAEQNATAANAALAAARWRLAERSVAAPAGGLVDDTLMEAGEMAAAGAPVVRLLPPGAVTVRFYVPETDLPALRPGQAVAIACDGCASGLTARIARIASQAEFTPPVIYSEGVREKLVYLIEATPEGDPLALRPGQPVDVTAGAAP